MSPYHTPRGTWMLNRRELLKGGALTVAVFTGVLPGLRVSAQGLRIRRDVATLTDDDDTLRALRQFVAEMRARPAGKLPNWATLYSIHGTLTDGFNKCPHRNWFFLPWHRAYMEMYENLVIDLTGYAQFALPYWNWTEQRSYPASFTAPMANGLPNPLQSPAPGDDPKRLRKTLALADADVGRARIVTLLQEPNFELFGSSRPLDEQDNPQNDTDQAWLTRQGTWGEFETAPHNRVHLAVGGAEPNDTQGYMGWAESAHDPIFIVHHTNVDRLWTSWRGVNPLESIWRDMEFTNNFVRADGSLYSVKVADLLDNTQRGYGYDKLEDVAVRPGAGDASRLLLPAPLPSGQRVRALPASGGAGSLTPLRFPQLAPGSALAYALRAGDDVYAVLRDITLGPHVVGARVFVNLPGSAAEATTSTPQFVAEIAFISGHHHSPEHDRFSVSLNLGPALRRLASQNLLTNDVLSLQIVPVFPEDLDPRRREGTVMPGAVDIGVP